MEEERGGGAKKFYEKLNLFPTQVCWGSVGRAHDVSWLRDDLLCDTFMN